MNEFARQLTAKYARRGRPPLTEDVQGLLAFHADITGSHTQPIIADAIEEGGLPMSREDLDRLREDPRRLYVHPHGDGYRVLPEPVLTMADIQRRSEEAGNYSLSSQSMRAYNSQPDRKVHQGPGGTYFVYHTTTDRRDNSHVRRFNLRSGRAAVFVHPEGRYGADVPDAENQYFHQARTPEAAHSLAAHLAEHGRLPENNNE